MDHAPGGRDFLGRLTSRGRLTVPKPVRDALGWQPGDEIVFRVDGDRVVLAKMGARPGESLEDGLAAFAEVRSGLRGSMDAVAVVREGRRELEGRSWPSG
jgi:AbrB family looped-hinge helix DNA binding protein